MCKLSQRQGMPRDMQPRNYRNLPQLSQLLRLYHLDSHSVIGTEAETKSPEYQVS